MTYTIEDINDFVQDEDNEFDGSWYEFAEACSATEVYVRNPDASELVNGRWVDKDGYLREPLPENSTWAPLVRRKLERAGVTIPNVGQATLVEEFGGEGMGDQLWFVFKITDDAGNERLFRRNGWYQSYSGGEFDGPTEEVKPVEKVVTVYKAI